MKYLTKILLTFSLLFCFQTGFSQDTETAEEELSLENGTIENQFEYIFRKSGNFKGTDGQNYEAVKFNSLLKIKANVLDSLNTTYKLLETSENTVSNQFDEIEALKSQLQNTNSTLETTNKEKNSMSLFGLQMSKGGYNVLLWSIIGGLLALLLLFIVRFKTSNSATKEAKRKLEETELEFEEHRRVALEREQKVRRQLQDEINKNKN